MKNLIDKILFIAITILLIFFVFSSLKLSFFGFRIFKIGSGSMAPALNVNDIILVKTSKEYKENDIITYKNEDDEYITHRIIKIEKDNIIAKGDANNLNDKKINKNMIVGKLIFKINNFGFLSFLLEKPFTWALLFIIGIVITIFIPDKKRKEIKNYE